MKKRYIYLVRHGETDANKNDIYQGASMNPPLNKKGEKQVELLAKFLIQNYPDISKIVFSPAIRTLQTAHIIERTYIKFWNKVPNAEELWQHGCIGISIATEKDLHEVDHGDWEGKTSTEVANQYPKLSKKWWRGDNPFEIEFPGGEKIKDAVKRIYGAFLMTLETHQDEHLVIVAHGGTNAIILSEILETQNFRRISQANTALNIIRQRDGIFRIKLVNSTAHLF